MHLPEDIRRACLAAFLLLPPLLSGCASHSPPATLDLGGQRIAYRLQGQGPGPTVVLQAGLGDSQQVWSELTPRLVARYRVFSLDRPGYGGSPRTTVPRDPCTQARELHASLRAAGAAPPYLLVGHSLGGLYQHAFARLYPGEVAGLLLIEPTHPDHWVTLEREAPALAALVRAMRATAFTPVMRAEFDAQGVCLDSLPALPDGPPPARLLRRSAFPLMEQGSFAAMVGRLWEDWRRLAALQGIDFLPGDDHHLQRSQPAAVAAAVDDMVSRLCPVPPTAAAHRPCPR